jgi:hypothetical protein
MNYSFKCDTEYIFLREILREKFRKAVVRKLSVHSFWTYQIISEWPAVAMTLEAP